MDGGFVQNVISVGNSFCKAKMNGCVSTEIFFPLPSTNDQGKWIFKM